MGLEQRDQREDVLVGTARGDLDLFVPGAGRHDVRKAFALKKSFKSVCGTGDPLPAPRRRDRSKA